MKLLRSYLYKGRISKVLLTEQQVVQSISGQCALPDGRTAIAVPCTVSPNEFLLHARWTSATTHPIRREPHYYHSTAPAHYPGAPAQPSPATSQVCPTFHDSPRQAESLQHKQ